MSSINLISRNIESVRARGKGWSFALLIALALRSGLSLWMATVWSVVDQYLPRSPQVLLFRIGAPTMHSTLIGRMFLDVWRRWDAISFLGIAELGYGGVPTGHLNYYPLYPIAIRLLSVFTFGEFTLAGLIISSIATGLALILFQNLVLTIFDDARLAKWTILVWAIFPTSIFLFAPFSDSLFLCFAIGTLLAVRRKHWILGGFLASLAGLTRAQGIILGLPIALEVMHEVKIKRQLPSARMMFSIILAPLGWIFYEIWRYRQGVPLIIKSYQVYSKSSFIDPISAITLAIRQAFETGSLLAYSEVVSLLGFTIVFAWMLLQKRFRQHADLVAYSIATLLPFLMKHNEVASALQSSNRYVLSLFPVFIGVASLVQKLPPRLRETYVIVNLIGLILVSTLYALFYFVG